MSRVSLTGTSRAHQQHSLNLNTSLSDAKPTNIDTKIEFARKRQMLWADDDTPSRPWKTVKLGSDSDSCDSDDSDTFNPAKASWRNKSLARTRRRSCRQDDTIRIVQNGDNGDSLSLKTPPLPSPADSDTTILLNVPPPRIDNNLGTPKTKFGAHQNGNRQLELNTDNEKGTSVADEDTDDYSDMPTPIVSSMGWSSDSDSDVQEVDSACMFNGGHKRNLRDQDLTIPITAKLNFDLYQTENLNIVTNCSDIYKPGTSKTKLLVDPSHDEFSNVRNNEAKHVYFNTNDLQITQPGKLDPKQVTWNTEYPGCYVARCKTYNTVAGFMKIEAHTIRPFSRVESEQPMHIVVITGEIILKTNIVYKLQISNTQETVLRRVIFKAGDIIILNGGTPYSLENHTDSTVHLTYSFFDVR